MTFFGPQAANAATTQPSGKDVRRYGGQQTWVKDASVPGANDGTVLDAAFFNRLIGSLEYLVQAGGVTGMTGDDSILYRAVLGSVQAGAPAALDTLAEIAAALGGDAGFAANVNTQLGYRVSVNGVQSFTGPQKAQGRNNLGLGNVATLNTGTAAGNVVQLDISTAKLPAVDGSLLTNVTVTWANVTGQPTLGTAAALNVGTGPGQIVQLDGGGNLEVLGHASFGSGGTAASAGAGVNGGLGTNIGPYIYLNKNATLRWQIGPESGILGGVGTLDDLIFNSAGFGAAFRIGYSTGNVAVGGLLTVGGNAIGTAAYNNVGTAASNVVQLDGTGRLPAVDGSQLTGVVASTAVGGAALLNGSIVESHASGAVTYAVKTAGGADPSTGTPVTFVFPNASGGYALVGVTAALSITVPSGATLGNSVNGLAFRVWIAAFNDAGTVRLAVRTCTAFASGLPYISSPPESRPASSTLTPANGAQVFYTTGAAVTSKYWAWIAHATYESGLATAGTWGVSPDFLSLVNQSTPRPGAFVQEIPMGAGGSGVTDTLVHTFSAANISLFSAANLVEVEADGDIYLRTGSIGNGAVWWQRDSTIISAANSQIYSTNTGDSINTIRPKAFDKPNKTTAALYQVMGQNQGSAALINYGVYNCMIRERVG